MSDERKKVTLRTLFAKMERREPLTMLTCYDYPTAYLMEQAGVDILLVGDSLGMTVLGYDSTLPVTMDIMIAHAQAVRRGSPNAWLIGDMPYMSYQPSVETAIRSAGRFMAEAACDAIKLEGGIEVADRVASVVQMGIPVMGHLGLTPQSVHAMGGYRVQGRDVAAARPLIADASALDAAGVFAIVLEGVPDVLAEIVTKEVSAPTIGIGAGCKTDGQVLVFHDVLGLGGEQVPKFVRTYADLRAEAVRGLEEFFADVQSGAFPAEAETYHMPDEAVRALLED